MVKYRHARVGFGKQYSPNPIMVIITLLVTFTLLVLFLSLSPPYISSGYPNDLNSVARNEAEDEKKQWVENISWNPRAFLYHNFLTKEECEYLINIAKPNMRRSTIVDRKTGQNVDSRIRTSSGTFLARGRDKIVSNIEKRIADITFLPVENGEGLQILHYEVGQKYDPHTDYFSDENITRNGGDRIATMLMYLSDVEEGGETVFPHAGGDFSSVPWWNDLSDCGKKGLAVKPKMGDALLFWSMKPDASMDPRSLHENGEGLQILHYEVGQKYDPHTDYFSDENITRNGGDRIATMLMYLSDVEEGGETVFPHAGGDFSSVPWWNDLSDCGKKGLAVKPKMGDALLFWSMKPDASMDPRSLHGACPVIKGNKWSCTKWMRLYEYK